MASITYWNRLEPRPRAEAIGESLAARVRDPLWFLTRQWQFGEFQGADSGSPAFASLTIQEAPLVAWRPGGDPVRALADGAPLEQQVLAEPYPDDDLSLVVELGQLFETLLTEATLGSLIGAFRGAYPVPARTEADLAAMPDREAARFLRVCGGRALDGVALYRVTATLPALPAQPGLDSSVREGARQALTSFRAWVERAWGQLGASDPPAWDPARLSHALDVIGVAPVTGGTVALAADPGSDGDGDWDAFDQREGDAPAAGALPPVTTNTTSIIPTVVRFRGMPNARWWTFENGTVDFGDIRPEKRDLARLILMDFMLIHGNDWFLVPVEVPVGTLCRIDALIVRDVFGGQTLVERADAGSAPAGARWTMFSTAIQGAADRVADFLVVPSSAPTALQVGTAIEGVRLLRDEVANMAWAIEQVTANGLGDAWPVTSGISVSAPPSRLLPPPRPMGLRCATSYRRACPSTGIPCCPWRSMRPAVRSRSNSAPCCDRCPAGRPSQSSRWAVSSARRGSPARPTGSARRRCHGRGPGSPALCAARAGTTAPPTSGSSGPPAPAKARADSGSTSPSSRSPRGQRRRSRGGTVRPRSDTSEIRERCSSPVFAVDVL